MGFPKKNIELLGFDDLKFFWLGVIIATLIIPLLFQFPIEFILAEPMHVFLDTFIFTLTYFLFYRYAIIYFRKRLPHPRDLWKRVGYLIGISIIANPGISIVVGGLLDLVKLCLNSNTDHNPPFLQLMIITYLLTLTVIAIYEAAYFFKKYTESQVEKERLEARHAQLRLHNLRNQINPHFLFNSLNILMGLIATNTDMAMSYLGKLSRFYRYTVGQNENQTVPLEEELANAKLFAELLKVRFDEGLFFEWPEKMPIEGEIIPLSLQLLIENAVKHNVCSPDKPLHIVVEIQQDYITVKNNLQPKITPVESSGIGLKNIEERFGFFTDYKMRIQRNDDYFSVSVPIIK